MYTFKAFSLFILGSLVGSFLNVCIHRLPREESIVSPSSHCPHCKVPIAWYDNIPFLSYLLLKGRCRHCGKEISFRYFLVELLTASLFLLGFAMFGLGVDLVIYLVFVSLTIVATFIDFEHLIIPDLVSLTGIGLGLLFSTVHPQLQGTSSTGMGLIYSLAGATAGAGVIYFLVLVGPLIFKKEAMGGGDVKLMAMIGAFLGWKYALLSIFIGALTGAVVGSTLILLSLKGRKDYIPFGPYLSLGGIISLLWGEEMLRWYCYHLGWM